MNVFEILQRVFGVYGAYDAQLEPWAMEMLHELDLELKETVMDRCEGAESIEVQEHYSADTEMLLGCRYADLYMYYLLAKLYERAKEYEAYENAAAQYNQRLSAWRSAYIRKHIPKGE